MTTATASSFPQQLKFEALKSSTEAEFWHQFANKKLQEYKLDKSEKPIYATYNTGGQYAEVGSLIRLGKEGFLDPELKTVPTIPSLSFYAPGTILNANTVEEFNNYDKKQLLYDTGKEILKAITTGSWLEDPSVLVRFRLISFADLKVHKFYHWYAFPALLPAASKAKEGSNTILLNQAVAKLSNEYPCPNAAEQLQNEFAQQKQLPSAQKKGFFLVSQKGNTLKIEDLTQWKQVIEKSDKWYLGFADPCALAEYPGWPLRNFLFAAAHTFGVRDFNVMCLREIPTTKEMTHSIILNVTVPQELISQQEEINCTGWEKNLKGKLSPKVADLGEMMDPLKLAENAVSLNLSLMKWRMLPSLDMELLSKTRCLLVGAGTLGCHVARNLLSWGIFNMTFLDKSRVSFSNPVRQPLYEYEDCLNGGKHKALSAAEHIKRIHPSANAQAVELEIPMPGHPISEAEKATAKKNYETLEKLIEDHDVVFLLTDTRESRWLPSVIGAAKGKIIMNAALGFESFVVMRHGMYSVGSSVNASSSSTTTNSLQSLTQRRLGCYFCNDVIAPVNSTRDRTLDQQCTVTRPGSSALAGAIAVELLVALLHHPKRGDAPADMISLNQSTANAQQHQTETSPVGLVPHQVRGSLTTFLNNILIGVAYSQCTACSEAVVEAYKSKGFSFLEQVCNNSSYLEEITGLKELHQKAQEIESLIELVDDDEEDF